MRKHILALAAAICLGTTIPAIAYDSGSLLSMQDALDVAFDAGLVAVSDAEFVGYEWQIDGRDAAGRYMEIDVDATTGTVLNINR